MNNLQRLVWFGTLYCLVGVCISIQVCGQTSPVPTRREKNKALIQSTLESNTKEHGANSNMLVRPGLLANRVEKWVKVQAEAVGTGSNSPCEFMLISEASGHDYEALMISFAKPSDIHEALVFIGIKPGRPVDGNKYCFWPKGERIITTVEWDNDGPHRARGESLIVNSDMQGPLPKDGFVFVGSVMKKAPNNSSGTNVYAADAFGPNCIVSYFNDPETVLDIPRVASQGAMYDIQHPNPVYSFSTGQLVNVVFKPEYEDGKRRVSDFVLKITPPALTAAVTLSNAVVRLTDAAGTSLIKGTRLQDTLAVFEEVIKDGRDPFVRIEFDAGLPLSAVRNVCTFLDAINTARGIRIEPPPVGHAYYRAFIPDEKLRTQANRSMQPWELRISEKNGKVGSTLILIEDKVDRATEKWHTVTNHYDASAPETIRKAFETKTDDGTQRAGPPYVFVFAPKSMLYGSLAPYLAACLETRPYVHVYLE